jgi:hypothetical protein
MSDEWYLHDGNEQAGPFGAAELTAKLATCRDPASILVWRADFEEWQRAGDVVELAKLLLPPAPPSLPPRAAGDDRVEIAAAGADPWRPAKWRWSAIGALVAIPIDLADLLLAWRGPFAPWHGDGLAHNIGRFAGVAVLTALIGLVAGLVRDWGSAREPLVTAADPAGHASQNRQNFIAKAWRGEYPLWVTYWIFGFLGNIIAGAIPLGLAQILSVHTGYDPRGIFIAMAAAWLGVLTIGLWQLVAVWRSARRRIFQRTRIGKFALWAAIAKLAVVFGLARLVAAFGLSGLPQLTEASRMAFRNDPSIPSYSIRVMRDGTEVEITGGIKFGLTDDFLKILAASPQIGVVHLNSIGGRIGEAQKLGKIIRERKLDTYTSAQCLSACTLAFAAGRARWMHRRAELGFHGPAFPGTTKAALQESVDSQKESFALAGFDRGFVERGLSIPSNEMWTPSIEELLRANVITGVSDGNEFAASGFDPGITQGVMSIMLANSFPAFQTLKVKMPLQFAVLAETYYGDYLAGRTEGEMRRAVRSKFAEIVASERPSADDHVLLDLGRLYADQYEALGAVDPTLCYSYASGSNATNAASAVRSIPPSLLERENFLYERIIASSSTRPPVTRRTTGPIWTKVFRQLLERGIDLEIVRSTNVETSKHADYCAASVALMREVASLGPAEAHLLFREMWRAK